MLTGRIYLLFESVALLACIMRFRQLHPKLLRWFLVLLLLVNAVEWGTFFRLYRINNSNNWIFNLLNTFQFIFYACIYYHLLLQNKARKYIAASCAVLALAIVVNIAFLQGISTFNSYTFIAGCACTVYWSYFYLMQQVESMETTGFTNDPFFWISIGLMIFHAGEFFLMSFFQYFSAINEFGHFFSVFSVCSNLLNAILYTCLTIAFFCRRAPQKPL